MKKHYDIVFLTNIPAFYKIRQWNEVGNTKKLLAIFVSAMENDRNEDFFSEKPEFDYVVLASKSRLVKVMKMMDVLIHTSYERLIIGGWDSVFMLLAPWMSPKRKNGVICESSIFEYRRSGLKDAIKKLFLSRISTGYPCGVAQAMLLDRLGFRGELRPTGGCGLLNYVEQPPYEERRCVKEFLYVGRLVEVKNLALLIEVFNRRADLHLMIVGFGELEGQLKAMAGANVEFMGAVKNKELPDVYRKADVFVLTSSSETWGLVVEEALNNGTPVIVSDKVGCRLDLVTDETGLVFDHDSGKSLMQAVDKMTDIAFYNRLRKNISGLDFLERARQQVDVYLD